MGEIKLSRQAIIDNLAAILPDFPYILAAWLGGSDASGRTDALSDIDLQLVVEDDRVEDALAQVHRCLEALSPIAHRFRFPEPVWHGHSQELLSLRDADPCHFLDLVVMKKSAPDRFLERERHGEPLILFDRERILTPPPMDWPAHRDKMARRLSVLREQFFLFQPLVDKAARRGHTLDALHAYVAATLRPLVEILRMRFCPERYDYGPRYLDRDLPADWQAELERLALPASLAQLAEFRARAQEHFQAQLDAFERGEWRLPDPGGPPA